MRNLFVFKGLFSLIVLSFPLAASAQQFYVSGPVSAVDLQKKQLTVLGHLMSFGSCTRFAIDERKIAASEAFELLAAGISVHAEFETSKEGLRVTSVSIASEPYVAGSSIVQVGSKISRRNMRNGTIDLAQARVDTTALRPEVVASLTNGTFVEISAVQPVLNGTLVSTAILAVAGSRSTIQYSEPKLLGTVCSASDRELGAHGVGGSGALGIGGSGALGIGGSGALGVGGSGTLGVGGSGTLAVSGSGSRGVSGSDI